MGFSVSGSAALIFVALFIGFGMFYTATANSFEQISDAREDRSDRMLDQQNTDIVIVSATWDADGSEELDVTVDNTGATTLRVSDTDLLVDNVYESGYTTSVDTDSTTDLWHPEEQLTITVTGYTTAPDRVKVVTENGVADTSGVN